MCSLFSFYLLILFCFFFFTSFTTILCNFNFVFDIFYRNLTMNFRKANHQNCAVFSISDNDVNRFAKNCTITAVSSRSQENRQIFRIRSCCTVIVNGHFCTNSSLVSLYMVSSWLAELERECWWIHIALYPSYKKEIRPQWIFFFNIDTHLPQLSEKKQYKSLI